MHQRTTHTSHEHDDQDRGGHDACRDAKHRASPTAHVVRGIALRSVVMTILMDRRQPTTIQQLAKELERRRLTTPGRVSKDISDALRWEARRGRLSRPARGRYEVASVPKTTRRRIRHRAMAAQASRPPART